MSAPARVRKYQRVALPRGAAVAFEHSGKRQIARVGVMAVGGIFIATPHPAPVGDVIKLVFEVPGGEVRARARVCDSQPGKGMGVQFTAMAQDARARLAKVMKTLTRI